MKLGFINFSTEEQLKMHQVMQAIQEHQAIDELGLGRIRDAFSNKLFPGISTLHNRAKYYAILPSLFLEAEKGTYKSANEVRAKVLNLEIKLTRQLLRGTEPANNWGITGSSVIDAAEAENSFSIKVPIVVPKVVFFKALLAPLSALFPLISFNQLDGFMLILSNQLDKKRVNLSDTDNGIMK